MKMTEGRTNNTCIRTDFNIYFKYLVFVSYSLWLQNDLQKIRTRSQSSQKHC